MWLNTIIIRKCRACANDYQQLIIEYKQIVIPFPI